MGVRLPGYRAGPAKHRADDTKTERTVIHMVVEALQNGANDFIAKFHGADRLAQSFMCAAESAEESLPQGACGACAPYTAGSPALACRVIRRWATAGR